MKLSIKNYGRAFAAGLLLFVVIFFGRIFTNVAEHNEYKADFNKKCTEAGGWTYVPKGTKGFSRSICLQKEALIKI